MKSVTILGAMASIPYDGDDSSQLWGLNSLWRYAFDAQQRWRAHRWFELHPRDVNTAKEQEAVWSCALSHTPIYVLDRGDWVASPPATWRARDSCSARMEHIEDAAAHILEYPIQAVAKISDYFCSTFAYQVALALLEGFERIELRGIDLTRGSKRERLIEKPNLEWWLGYAEGRGVKIVHPVDSMMSRHEWRYGYDYWEELDAGAEQVQRFDFAPVETPPKRVTP